MVAGKFFGAVSGGYYWSIAAQRPQGNLVPFL